MGSKAIDFPEDELLEATLNQLVESKTMQWIFVGGKGGVGKTTTACSIAVQLAQRRENVLILSTDPAHNLSDAFSQKFSNAPTKVNGFKNLFAMEIDASIRENNAFQLTAEDELGLSKILPELLSAFPGIDEAMSFAELMQAVQIMNYSVIVFDTAPTGHTLRLLSFPDLLDKAFRKFQTLKDKMSGLTGAFSMFTSMGGDSEQGDLSKRFDHIRAVTASVREMFRDPTRTTFVCVCIPEFLSVYETERLVQELLKQEIDASYIVVNQILFPVENCESSEQSKLIQEANIDGIHDDYAKNLCEALLKKANALEKSHLARRKMQSKYLAQIRDLYGADFHVVPMPLRGDEVRGLDHLKSFGNDLLIEKPLPIIEDE